MQPAARNIIYKKAVNMSYKIESAVIRREPSGLELYVQLGSPTSIKCPLTLTRGILFYTVFVWSS